MALQNLTDSFIRGLGPAKSGIDWTWDSNPKGRGLGVYVTKAGAKSYLIRYKFEGRERRLVLGSADPRSNLSPGDARRDWEQWLRPGERPALNVATARAFAALVRDRVAAGHDPLQDRKNLTDEFKARSTSPTMGDLAGRYLEWTATHNRPRTVDDDRLLIAQHVKCERIGPNGEVVKKYSHKFVIAKLKVAEVERKHIERLRDEIKHDFGTPIRASHVVMLLSGMFRLAQEWGWATGNPARGVKRDKAEARKRYLDIEAELPRLVAALEKFRDRDGTNAIKLLLMTGSRRGEVLGARWDQFDLDAGRWTKPASGTKQKRTHIVYLSPQAMAVLRQMRASADRGIERAEALEREAAKEPDHIARGTILERARLARAQHDTDFLFPSARRAGQRLGSIRGLWREVLLSAKLKDFRIHDLRHSYASFLVRKGFTLQMVGDALGHSSLETSGRYAHIMADHAKTAATTIGGMITAAAHPPAKVVKLSRRRK